MDKTQLLDFLYGEMNAEEEKAFKERLSKEPELRMEFESMQHMRGFLNDHEDEVPTGQPIVFPAADKKNFFNSRWWAVAASLAILLIGGKLLDLRVSVGDNQFAIQFGEPQNKEVEKQPDELKELDQLAMSIDLLKHDLLDRLDSYETQLKDSGVQINKYQRQMASLVNDLKKDQADLAISLWDQFKSDQKEHTELLVDDFIEYVEVQRLQDLQLINESMNNLAQLIQFETDQKAQYAYQPVQK